MEVNRIDTIGLSVQSVAELTLPGDVDGATLEREELRRKRRYHDLADLITGMEARIIN